MDAKKILKTAETTIVVTGAAILSAYIWWPVGPVVAGVWYLKRRWRKNPPKRADRNE